jgi:biotin operon repressor/anti-sigma regulatory factor (Ser/Thr protein kinase)
MGERRRMADSNRRLLSYLAKHSPASGPELCRHLGITRQALSQKLRPLIAAGDVVKAGSTRAALYYAPAKSPAGKRAARSLPLRGADESRAYDEIDARLSLRQSLRPNVAAIVHYAFTEMLNNAIEHSHAAIAKYDVHLDPGLVRFEIQDRGIGLFRSIADKLALPDEHAALAELIKGRTTTLPEAHSGEGIFFTARAADKFVLRSHRIRLEWDRARADTFVSDERFMKGTTVEFTARRDSRRDLERVFSEFAPEEYDYRFEKTEILVALLRPEYISRSEARRLTANLDKFRKVVLDFKGVRSMGQGFADEVFRVFAGRHPDTSIEVVNASPAVGAMLQHARRDALEPVRQ